MVTFSKISNSGGRPVNEDSVGASISGERYCFTLCDGLGGHGLGDVASAAAVEAFGRVFSSKKITADKFFPEAFAQAQNDIIEHQSSLNDSSKMKTTLVSLVIGNGRFFGAHIGDSRLYCFKNGKVYSRTEDHSVTQMLVKSGDIAESEIRFHPDRNKLLRVLGEGESALRYEIGEMQKLDPDCAFLLCSDGFWEYITEDEMEAALAESRNSGEWLSSMQETVIANGRGRSMDNFSAIAIMVNDGSDTIAEIPVESELLYSAAADDSNALAEPDPDSARSSVNPKILIVAAIIVLLAVAAVFLVKSMIDSKKQADVVPTSYTFAAIITEPLTAPSTQAETLTEESSTAETETQTDTSSQSAPTTAARTTARRSSQSTTRRSTPATKNPTPATTAPQTRTPEATTAAPVSDPLTEAPTTEAPATEAPATQPAVTDPEPTQAQNEAPANEDPQAAG